MSPQPFRSQSNQKWYTQSIEKPKFLADRKSLEFQIGIPHDDRYKRNNKFKIVEF